MQEDLIYTDGYRGFSHFGYRGGDWNGRSSFYSEEDIRYREFLRNAIPYSGQYHDEHGRPNRDTPSNAQYSYDPYVLWMDRKNWSENNRAVYSDRMSQWDYNKNDQSLELAARGLENSRGIGFFFGAAGHPEKIELYLQLYNNDPKLKLTMVMQGANKSSGYPYWVFWYQQEDPYQKSLKEKCLDFVEMYSKVGLTCTWKQLQSFLLKYGKVKEGCKNEGVNIKRFRGHYSSYFSGLRGGFLMRPTGKDSRYLIKENGQYLIKGLKNGEKNKGYCPKENIDNVCEK